MTEIKEYRLRRKIESRDRKIAGLERRIKALERMATSRGDLPRDVERAVQRALCNVRMIPVMGLSGSNRVVEVRAIKEPTP